MIDSGSHFILLASALVLLSIVAALLSARWGTPLLLIFLGIGVLAGYWALPTPSEQDFRLVYVIGNAALALILFDGGLRTPLSDIRLAGRPASLLATLGVVVTMGVVGLVAAPLLGLPLAHGMLVGATVASTDAAAVLFLMRLQGARVEKRVAATLEIESGVNDPLAVFLTILLVDIIRLPGTYEPWELLLRLVWQIGAGALLGWLAGQTLVRAINRLVLAAGLYPILVLAAALFIFALAHLINASGFLAVYIAGVVMANSRHRAAQLIDRFHDGMAWLAQIVMFLLLGLLVTPEALLGDLLAATVIAIVLMLVARPAAVFLCLLPFRFSLAEKLFVSWVGLRGAVPIFLATIPIVAGMPDGLMIFHVAFVAVVLSLLLQGWTIASAARALGLALPPEPESGDRLEIGTAAPGNRDFIIYRLQAGAPALRRHFAELPLPARSRVVAVIRDNALVDRAGLERLQIGDTVLMLVPPEQALLTDRLFSVPQRLTREDVAESLGDFVLEGGATLADLGRLYGLTVGDAPGTTTLGDYLAMRLDTAPVVGDRIAIGEVDLVVRELDEARITRIGLAIGGRKLAYQTGLRRLGQLWRRLRRDGLNPPPQA